MRGDAKGPYHITRWSGGGVKKGDGKGMAVDMVSTKGYVISDDLALNDAAQKDTDL